ncbi:MAG: phosphodiester glycosidase family protein [bacterium]
MNLLRPFIICSLILSLLPTNTSTAAIRTLGQKSITKDIKYIHLVNEIPQKNAWGYDTGIKYQHLYVIKIDYNNKKNEVQPAIAFGMPGAIEPTSRIAKYQNALAAVNGGFFHVYHEPQLPIGLIIIDGKIVSKSLLSRTTMGITKNRKFVFGYPRVTGKIVNPKRKVTIKIWGINRPRKENEIILYTYEYGDTTMTNLTGKELIVKRNLVIETGSGNSEIPKEGFVISFHGRSNKFLEYFPVGSQVEMEYGLANEWREVDQAITGGPRLIKNSQIVVAESIKRENFRGSLLTRNARTAIGVTKKNFVILLVAEKSYQSMGATYSELATYMKYLNCVDAMGLDGGGGSTMVIGSKIMNKLQDGWQRHVSNAVIVKTN